MGYGTKPIEVLILGLGNELLSDDGVGVYAARKLLTEPLPESVVIVEAGTAILRMQHLLERAVHVIAIDAVRAGDAPGSIYCFDIDQAHFERPASLHEMGIVGVLKLMPAETRPKTVVVGIEPEKIEFDMKLSQTVQTAVPQVVKIVKNMIQTILSDRVGDAATLMTGLMLISDSSIL